MNSKFCTYKRVGYLRRNIAEELGIEFTGVIYASPGVLKHIIKRHGKQLDKKIKNNIFEFMRAILDEPDYIGIYKSDEGNVSIEFVKKMYSNLLLGVGVDEMNQYIYVSTMYPINEKKIQNRVCYGELKELTYEWNIFIERNVSELYNNSIVI